jgi:hypothetical protein
MRKIEVIYQTATKEVIETIEFGELEVDFRRGWLAIWEHIGSTRIRIVLAVPTSRVYSVKEIEK